MKELIGRAPFIGMFLLTARKRMEQQQELRADLPDELVGLILAFTDPSPRDLCRYASLCKR
jgi:hypothetical protein